ncbi:MFS transporter [Methylophaga sp. OBS4]|uniref:MFS transporter n=1 Tax=Methylophaga sp. OBS4 TaxID=2991935 RepID=UPI0022566F8F|nr:MFS transporter [Methylophaga sp. OBS4]MCX4187002.1 MFS transporter [Methylophaga sp. OBS4]
MGRVLPVVLACHFLAAFTVLGMPLFLPRLLSGLGVAADSLWIGVMFSLPTVMTALTAPWWGKFADRFGRKTSLLRALGGLVLAFVLAGIAPSLPIFVLALVMQGLFGGTLAAANSYLAEQFDTGALGKALNWTQFTARLALVLAPIGLGLLLEIYTASPQRLYLWLALLPLTGLLLALFLPVEHSLSAQLAQAAGIKGKTAADRQSWPLAWLLLLQFLFTFSMVVTFPYFLPYASHWVSQASAVGVLYSLPHLFYLLLLPLMHQRRQDHRHLALGLLLLMLAAGWQAFLDSSMALVAARIMFGIGIFLAYCGLNQLISQATLKQSAGSWFGRLDAVGKWAGVIAGVVAGWLCSYVDTRAPFIASSLVACTAFIIVFLLMLKEPQDVNVTSSR